MQSLAASLDITMHSLQQPWRRAEYLLERDQLPKPEDPHGIELSVDECNHGRGPGHPCVSSTNFLTFCSIATILGTALWLQSACPDAPSLAKGALDNSAYLTT